MYLIIKHSHILFALLSITLFIIRASWSVLESPRLNKRWVKIVPHIIDTLLLLCAIYLMFSLKQYPFEQNWLTAKLFALLVYIGLGTVAIKRGSTPAIRFAAAIAATTVFIYIAGVAFNHNYLSWF